MRAVLAAGEHAGRREQPPPRRLLFYRRHFCTLGMWKDLAVFVRPIAAKSHCIAQNREMARHGR